MPMYDMVCPKGHSNEEYVSYKQYDHGSFGRCGRPDCSLPLTPCIPESVSLYGLMRCRDEAFSDAYEATGQKVNSTRDIDRLERSGVIRAVTNPSRHRTFKDR